MATTGTTTTSRRPSATARYRRAEEDARRQEEMGERFLTQLADMFAQTRQDLSAQFMPRTETQARMDHMDEVVERIGSALEKLTATVGNFQEAVPRIYAERAETKQDLADLRTEIEKLKTAREADMQRGYGMRIEDMQGRYRGDMSVERGWRQTTQDHSSQLLGWVIGGGGILLVAAINVILSLALRK